MKLKVQLKKPTNKSSGPEGITGEFCQTFRKNTQPFSTILKKKNNKKHTHTHTEEGAVPSSFYEVIITLIRKPDKDSTYTQKERKTKDSNTDDRRCKNP